MKGAPEEQGGGRGRGNGEIRDEKIMFEHPVASENGGGGVVECVEESEDKSAMEG